MEFKMMYFPAYTLKKIVVYSFRNMEITDTFVSKNNLGVKCIPDN